MTLFYTIEILDVKTSKVLFAIFNLSCFYVFSVLSRFTPNPAISSGEGVGELPNTDDLQTVVQTTDDRPDEQKTDPEEILTISR